MRPVRAITFVFVSLGMAVTNLAGQDIEASSRRTGVPLPEAYFRQVQENPNLYEFERALFRRSSPGRTSATGEVRLPVVLALFNDSPAEPAITRDLVQAALFSGPSALGTITESYREMSRGVLDVGGEAYGWVRSSLTMFEVVGTDRGFGADARIGEYFVEALDSIDDSVDFSQYDNDGPDGIANSGDDDGFVDVITFEYLEVAASCGGPAIWPHRSSMQGQTGAPYATNDLGVGGDTIYIQDYITQSASACDGVNVQDAGVITHEFGHALGLPDYYHWIDASIGPYGRRWVLGCWALMAAGSWGCGPVTDTRAPFGPTHMIGHSKAQLGWVDYLEIGEVWNEEIVLEPAETTGRILRLPLDNSDTQFLLAEYRAPIGFDVQLPGEGVLLYQQDSQASRRPDPNSNEPYFLTMLEQDANNSLLLMAAEGGSRGEIGDAWGVDGSVGRLNAETSPSLRLRNGNWSNVTVHEVSVENDVARLVISTGLTPRLVDPTSVPEVMQIRTFAEPVRIAGGRGPYTGVGTLPDGFSLQGIGDEMFLVGALREAGPFNYSFAVRDAAGNLSNEVQLSVTAPIEWVVETVALIDAFLTTGSDAVTAGEREYLDEIGNGNGQYDVGDLRKWLRTNGG